MSVLASLAAEFVSYYKAILSRSMFSMHALVAVWRTTVIMGAVYWSLVIGVVFLIAEYFVTMWVRMGEEWPWISPSTLCYLTTAASALWVQKLESLGHIEGTNGTYVATLPSTGMQMDFSAADWLLLTEQTMMVTIILSRWLLPKGNMTHKDLSSLLLLYLALSADILDFSTIFNEPTVAKDQAFCYIILVVWTLSLSQFVLVLTNTTSVDKEDARITLKSIVCSSEIWQILVQIGMQDLPFLLVRVIALVQYKVFNFTIIFFVCKNTLVICLEMYHLVATCVDQHKKMKKRKQRMKHLKSKMASVKKVVGLGKLHNLTAAMKGSDGKQNDGNGDGGGGIEKSPAKPSLLSLLGSKVGKSKAEQGANETSTITNGSDNNAGSGKDSSQNKSLSFSAINPKGEATKTEHETALGKPITQNALLSALKKPGSKDVINLNVYNGPSTKEPTTDELARSGSELAGENNVWLESTNLWLTATPSSKESNRAEGDRNVELSNKEQTRNKPLTMLNQKAQGNGILNKALKMSPKSTESKNNILNNDAQNATTNTGASLLKGTQSNIAGNRSTTEENETQKQELKSDSKTNSDNNYKNKADDENNNTTVNNNFMSNNNTDDGDDEGRSYNDMSTTIGFLYRQNTTSSIPPLSHFQQFRNHRLGSNSSDGSLDSRNTKTPKSVFEEDHSVF